MKSIGAKKTETTTAEPDDANALSANQERALAALLSSRTHKEAALAAGVSETTLWRYMQDETFARQLREARRRARSHLSIRLEGASEDAVTILCELMAKESVPAPSRISAIRTVLEYSYRAEMDDFQARMEEWEKFIKAKQEQDAIDSAAQGGQRQ